MSVEDIVNHCIENSLEEDWSYSIEEYENNENTVILHAHRGFLTPELTEKLRRRLIFVDASSESIEDDHSVMYFLHYLEPEEDTFMDELAEPVSTENRCEIENKLGKAITEAAKDVPYTGDPYRVINHVVTNIEKELGVEIQGEDDKPLKEHARVGIGEQMKRYMHSDVISDDELEEVEERLEDSALDLFQRLVDNALNRDEFYEIFREEQMSSDHYRIRKALRDVGGYGILDIRKSEMARKHAEGENQQC